MGDVIKVSNLTKNFGKIKAVTELSFNVRQGQVYGFLGQNGAGKSTTMRMLLTLIRPDSGDIEIFGQNLNRHRKSILRNTGAIIEKPDLYKYLSGIENLRLFATMSGARVSEKKLMEQLEQVGLAERAHSKVKTYSQGMKQRLGIATALVHDPDLVILDEPTNGLDPQGIADIRKLILHLGREKNKTLLISSHLLSEVEQVADAMLIIDKGKKLVEGKVEDLFDPSETILELRIEEGLTGLEKIKNSSLDAMIQESRNNSIFLKVHQKDVKEILETVLKMDIGLISFNTKHSLEDYFLKLTSGYSYAETSSNRTF
ncbi:MAG TPA: ABC transporter ATP-binding protein [Chitinophagaceae bacterium]|nr:ABC transporter ATP-binding protein [Chitinophagales bacterium]HPG11506.1 ABC transporter ATP-binding protein [Chitinophagaceae bacterium]